MGRRLLRRMLAGRSSLFVFFLSDEMMDVRDDN
jgi:hypothetical protein